MSQDEIDLFNFPCEFPIKVMGRMDSDLENRVVEIINRHVDNLVEGAITSRPSGKGNFVAVTITITAHSREQLDNIYRDLTACDAVLMAL